MIHSLLNLFFPKVCAGCDAFLLSGENVICTSCRHSIPLTRHHLVADNEAFKKFYGKIPVEFVSTFFYYHKKGIVQQLVHSLKYKGNQEIGRAIADWYSPELRGLSTLGKADAIIPVPLHPKRLRERGYNQVTTFAATLAQNLDVAYNDSLLLRTVYSKTQTKKNLLGRTEVNTFAIFDVCFDATDHNKHYILVDDVLTTGSTLEACCRAMMKIPGAKISIICMAMSHS